MNHCLKAIIIYLLVLTSFANAQTVYEKATFSQSDKFWEYEDLIPGTNTGFLGALKSVSFGFPGSITVPVDQFGNRTDTSGNAYFEGFPRSLAPTLTIGNRLYRVKGGELLRSGLVASIPYFNPPMARTNFFFEKYSTAGQLQWRKRIENIWAGGGLWINRTPENTLLIENRDNRIVMGGSGFLAPPPSQNKLFFLSEYDATGATLRSVTVPGLTGTEIKELPGKRYLVLGDRQLSLFDSTLSLTWVREFDSLWGKWMHIALNGNILIGGNIQRGWPGNASAIICLDSAFNLVWGKELQSPNGNIMDEAWEETGRGVYSTGAYCLNSSNPFFPLEMMMVHISDTGNVQWGRYYPWSISFIPSNRLISSLRQLQITRTPDSGFIYTGSANIYMGSGGMGPETIMLKTNSMGQIGCNDLPANFQVVPRTFSWTLQNLQDSAGVVTVTDTIATTPYPANDNRYTGCSAGCFVTASVTGPTQVSFGTQPVFHAPSGGVTQYLWRDNQGNTLGTGPNFSPQITAPGNYTFRQVAVDGSCRDSITFNLQVCPAPYLNLGPDTSICANSTVLIPVPPGFTNPVWTPGGAQQMLPVSQPGNYFLAATDTVGCMQRDTISVFQNPLPQPDLGSDTTICFGDSVTLGAGAFASYQWQNGSTLPNFAANATGWYSVTVTDSNQCANTDSLYLTILPQVVAAFSFSDSAGYVSFTDQSLNAFSWNWDFGNGQSSTQQNPVTQFPPDSAFTVCLVVSDSLGCQDSSCMAILITNTPEPGSNELKLYPNPFRDEINYQYSGKERISSIKILDQMGRSVFSQQISQKRSTGNITTDHLPTGIYFIEIVAGAQRYIHKMVRIE